MKNLYYRLLKLLQVRQSNQDELLELIKDKKIVQKAVEGSMQKRIDLIERAAIRQKHV